MRSRKGYEDEGHIDYPVTPFFRAAFADMGLTKPLPAGHPVYEVPSWEPLPILPYNETEYLADLARLQASAPQVEAPKPQVTRPTDAQPAPRLPVWRPK